MRAYRPGDSVGELTPWPFENPASDYVILRGSPQASGRIDRGGASGDATRLGIWACTEGAFECTELGNELQTILTGRLRLTGPDGVTREFGPGDSIYTNKGDRVVWDILEDVVKVFFTAELD